MSTKNKELDYITKAGYSKMANSSIAICSIVRNCNKRLRENIAVIETLRTLFKESHVIVFENDSTDGTKNTLAEWQLKSNNTNCECTDFQTKTITTQKTSGVNRYFAKSRIEKMASYRNRYLQKVETLNLNPDYLLVIDLDIEGISIEGIAHSFGLAEYWDVIAANGYSYGPNGKKRYHDSYALVELGYSDVPQTEKSIYDNQLKWSFLKKGYPLMTAYSAHGGLSIYRYEAIKGVRYRVIENKDNRVEVRCEHFSFCHDIRNSGSQRIFINPNMEVCYQTISLNMIMRYLGKNLFSKKD